MAASETSLEKLALEFLKSKGAPHNGASCLCPGCIAWVIALWTKYLAPLLAKPLADLEAANAAVALLTADLAGCRNELANTQAALRTCVDARDEADALRQQLADANERIVVLMDELNAANYALAGAGVDTRSEIAAPEVDAAMAAAEDQQAAWDWEAHKAKSLADDLVT